MQRIVVNYIQRHQNFWNQILHIIGVPMTFVASIVLLVMGQPWWALGAFIGGYVLQFVGHAIERNEAGEVVLIKRILGLPYTEFGPEALAKMEEQSKSND